jgi:hypothetical protein
MPSVPTASPTLAVWCLERAQPAYGDAPSRVSGSDDRVLDRRALIAAGARARWRGRLLAAFTSPVQIVRCLAEDGRTGRTPGGRKTFSSRRSRRGSHRVACSLMTPTIARRRLAARCGASRGLRRVLWRLVCGTRPDHGRMSAACGPQHLEAEGYCARAPGVLPSDAGFSSRCRSRCAGPWPALVAGSRWGRLRPRSRSRGNGSRP